MSDGKRGNARMSDLIKREDAKNAVMWGNRLDGSVVDDICEKIDAIPSADRPQGEWTYCEDDDGQDGYRCSECGFFVPWYYDYEDSNYILDYKACPHCLARMKGADDDSNNV